MPRAGAVLDVLPPPAEGALSAAAVSKSVVLAGAGRGADVADVVSRAGGPDVADVVSRAKVVLGLLSQAGRGLLPAAGPPSWRLCRGRPTLCRAREGCRGQPCCRATRRGRGARRGGWLWGRVERWHCQHVHE